jgi:hypothetical protein
MHRALRELYDICDLERTEELTGWRRRRAELDAWIKRWIEVVEATQPVTDAKYLNTEFSDFLTERLIHNMMEDVVENCAKRDIKRRKIEVELTFLRKVDKQ